MIIIEEFSYTINRYNILLACLFVNCHNLVGESPYTIIDGVKYHLYERADAPDYFMRPADISRCFAGCSQLDDYNDIPDEWK